MDSGATAIRGAGSDASVGRRKRDIAELCIGYALILLVIWTPRPWQRLCYAVAASYLAAVLWSSFAGWKAMGLGRTNFVRSLWIVPAALLVLAAAMLVASRNHTLLVPGSLLLFAERYAGYAIGACIQQVLLQDLFLTRLLRLCRRPVSAALIAACLFSAAHLPSPILTAATMVWGFAACMLFLEYRNLYTLWMAHTILGIAIAMTIPGPVTHNMRVGLGYIAYSAHWGHHRSH